METLRIHQLEVRYRLPASASAERQRLDKVLTTVLNETLERALERAGIATHEEVCIRHLYVPVRLRLIKADSALALGWSLALADTLKQAIEEGCGTDVVRYGSRVHALIDLASGVALGDLRRAWAWKQLGLWHAAEGVSGRESTQELTRALVAEPTMIVPALVALAPGDVLQRLTPRLTVKQWLTLAHAALSIAGGEELLQHEVPRGPAAPGLLGEGRRLVEASRLAASLAQIAVRPADWVTLSYALAALVILEVEPAAFYTKARAARPFVGVVSDIMWSTLVAPSITLPGASHHDNGWSKPGNAAANGNREEEASTPMVPAVLDERSTPVNHAGAFSHSDHRHSLESIASGVSDERPLPVIRQSAWTQFGGLLFILKVVDALGLPEEMVAHPFLAERPLRWLLHRLALALVPAEPHDPAALAFAGLCPSSAPPPAPAVPPTAEEDAAIHACALRIQDSVRERLARAEPLPALMQFVCHRRAEIVTDPGWFEVRLALGDVSVDIRRAGLDLDPGYLPWLGVVVKFVYE